MSLNMSLSPASDVPIYRQIIQHIRRCVILGQLKPGEQLPAVRVLAESLVINPNTVARAYQEMIRDGLLESRSGIGVFVTEETRQVFSDTERKRRLEHAVEQLLHEVLVLDISLPDVRASLEAQWKTFQAQLSNRRKK
jgi:GntR family transcriptional regulator